MSQNQSKISDNILNPIDVTFGHITSLRVVLSRNFTDSNEKEDYSTLIGKCIAGAKRIRGEFPLIDTYYEDDDGKTGYVKSISADCDGNIPSEFGTAEMSAIAREMHRLAEGAEIIVRAGSYRFTRPRRKTQDSKLAAQYG